MNRGEQYWQRPVPAHPLVVLRPEASQGPGQPYAKRRPAARLQPASTGTARPRPPQASKQARARRSPTLPASKPPGLTRPLARFPEAAPEIPCCGSSGEGTSRRRNLYSLILGWFETHQRPQLVGS